jgi:hypothetical protein
MIIANIKKAEPIGDQIIEDAQINIRKGEPFISSKNGKLGDLRSEFEMEAQTIFRALRDSLPGGTFDQLVGLMLQEKASHFIVSHNR